MAKAAHEAGDVQTFTQIVQQNIGGPYSYVSLLGMTTYDVPDLLEKVEKGFPFRTFVRFQKNLDFEVEELASLVQITTRTLARRKEKGRLTADESDRLLRVTRVFAKALALFEGDVDAARTWFNTPAPALGNRTPQSIANTDVGVREVENLIGRLEHGVFS